jgi:hypothetical protein
MNMKLMPSEKVFGIKLKKKGLESFVPTAGNKEIHLRDPCNLLDGGTTPVK